MENFGKMAVFPGGFGRIGVYIFRVKGKLAHTFSGNASDRNYPIVPLVGETIVYRKKN